MQEPKKNQINFISADEIAGYYNDKKTIIIDVREQHEWDEGHIPNAVLIPLSRFHLSSIPDQSYETVILYCRSGKRCGLAANIMVNQGYEEKIHRLTGGFIAWEIAGLEKGGD
jgi:rhodanese-related sulfurtransferase